MSRNGQNSYAGLVNLKSYADFLSDATGKIKKYVFESNVRDFQGSTVVNKAIRSTLSAVVSDDSPDFWWLNNGITILATQVTITNGNFVIKDPQIVNGLQTSYSIHEHFKSAPAGTQDDRLLLVKIIVSEDEEVRNAVIVATNSQTNLLPSAIRAADNRQRDIEQYFEANGYFYDRRKNYYKNMGKPADQIFAVPYLAQAVLSIGLSEPDQARARPSTLIKRDPDYERIFSGRIPLEVYLWAARVQREVDKLIKTLDFSKEFKINMRFHLSMLVGYRLLGDVVHNPSQLAQFADSMPDLNILIPELAEELNTLLGQYTAANPGVTVDRIAKSADFVTFLKTQNAGIATPS
jgi:hypothetical protein